MAIYEFPFEYEIDGAYAATFECAVEYEAQGYINRHGVFEMEDLWLGEPRVEVYGIARKREYIAPDAHLCALIKAHMATEKFQDNIAIHAADSGNFEVAA